MNTEQVLMTKVMDFSLFFQIIGGQSRKSRPAAIILADYQPSLNLGHAGLHILFAICIILTSKKKLNHSQ